MQVSAIGLDIAKNVFQIHGVDAKGRDVSRKRLRRSQVTDFFGNLPVCMIGRSQRAVRTTRRECSALSVTLPG
jgi:transposase